jgi:hypothetical protein
MLGVTNRSSFILSAARSRFYTEGVLGRLGSKHRRINNGFQSRDRKEALLAFETPELPLNPNRF